MDWYAYLKRYVWDDTKTPYLVPWHRLSREQADHELFTYSFFIGLLFAAISIISLTDNAAYGRSHWVALYAVSVSAGAIAFGLTKSVYTAYYLALAPLAALAALAYAFLGGFAPDLASLDKLLIVGIALALLRYSMRVVAIAKAYQDMPEKTSSS
jgi:hypothetical protein